MESQPPKTRATIRDVAAAAGVSITTVSHVLNGKGRASEDTRRLVLDAAERVGYGADPVARSLRTGETGVLGIVFRPSDAISGSMNGTEYHIRVAGSAATAALSNGYGLLHIPVNSAVGRPSLPMDGCIVVGPFRDDPIVSAFEKAGLPVVTVDRDPDRSDARWSIQRDDRAGVRMLLDHLAAQGARRIALLTGLDENAWIEDTAAAYTEWMQEQGWRPRIERIREQSGALGARDLAGHLFGQEQPDAIVCATSRFASGVIQAAQEAGMRVPDQVMVAALSDSELARSFDPPITCLDLHGDVAGRESIALILHRLTGAEAPDLKPLAPTLRVRASTLRTDRPSSS